MFENWKLMMAQAWEEFKILFWEEDLLYSLLATLLLVVLVVGVGLYQGWKQLRISGVARNRLE